VKWFLQIRGPFLLLSVVLVSIGAAAARSHGFWNPADAVLLAAGVVCAHASVNLFNELSDHQTGIDAGTRRTPFSGGSGLLQAGATSPAAVRNAASLFLTAAAAIGVYFCFHSRWRILGFMAAGGLAARFYTSHLARWAAGECASGLTLGSFVVAGTYYAMTKGLTWEAAYLSVPPGILTFQLLFLNEFPDAEADRAGGRKHLVILLGKKKSAVLYASGMAAVYALIAAAPPAAGAPRPVRMALLTLPIAAASAAIVWKHHDDFNRMATAQGLNVLVVLLTDFLLAAGYWI
jgi:1,4-dihydroxy-2-naphthoate octaprenyltransferase